MYCKKQKDTQESNFQGLRHCKIESFQRRNTNPANNETTMDKPKTCGKGLHTQVHNWD